MRGSSNNRVIAVNVRHIVSVQASRADGSGTHIKLVDGWVESPEDVDEVLQKIHAEG